MDESSAFKNFINKNVVDTIGREVHHIYPEFSLKEFVKVSEKLPPLELKARVLLITAELKKHLPDSYKEAVHILVKTMEQDKLSGFSLWPFSEYISQFGLNDFDESMKAMYVMTQKFTSEFAVRPFILQNHAKVLKYFSKWATDKNVHIRRWVSEGSRPILPWGGKIPLFIMDPTHTVLLLDKLKFDEELYVRKSVANHLNDISKNHPHVVIDVLKMWQKSCPEKHQDKLDWIKRQALRTMIKKGDKKALEMMGVTGEAKVKISEVKLNKKKFKLGDKLEFSFDLTSTAKTKQKLVVDYAIDFVKAGNKKSAKVFKLKSFSLEPKEEMTVRKSHSLKAITTMKYYKGLHHVYIQINGKKLAEASFHFDV
jgi:3-methyladenine DNA glycosylase AlkC